MLACPVCGTTAVRRRPSAKVRTGSAAEPGQAPRSTGAPAAQRATRAVTLASVVREILARTEDVGRQFPEEARRIHYEEIPPRPIRGVATAEEARDLVDEGIPVVSLPVPPGGDTH